MSPLFHEYPTCCTVIHKLHYNPAREQAATLPVIIRECKHCDIKASLFRNASFNWFQNGIESDSPLCRLRHTGLVCSWGLLAEEHVSSRTERFVQNLWNANDLTCCYFSSSVSYPQKQTVGALTSYLDSKHLDVTSRFQWPLNDDWGSGLSTQQCA